MKQIVTRFAAANKAQYSLLPGPINPFAAEMWISVLLCSLRIGQIR